MGYLITCQKLNERWKNRAAKLPPPIENTPTYKKKIICKKAQKIGQKSVIWFNFLQDLPDSVFQFSFSRCYKGLDAVVVYQVLVSP